MKFPMPKKPLDFHALQIWIGGVCLLICRGAAAWTLAYKRGEFLTTACFTLLVSLIQVSDLRKRRRSGADVHWNRHAVRRPRA
jgi:hypothetical protein